VGAAVALTGINWAAGRFDAVYEMSWFGPIIDVVVIHDTSPFALSLSKGFDRLSPNGSKSAVVI
jgi:hypothetical protein